MLANPCRKDRGVSVNEFTRVTFGEKKVLVVTPLLDHTPEISSFPCSSGTTGSFFSPSSILFLLMLGSWDSLSTSRAQVPSFLVLIASYVCRQTCVYEVAKQLSFEILVAILKVGMQFNMNSERMNCRTALIFSSLTNGKILGIGRTLKTCATNAKKKRQNRLSLTSFMCGGGKEPGLQHTPKK